jgi:hypothetical protein
MFFYGEESIVLEPTVIANRLTTNNMPAGQSVTLDLSGALADDLLIVYSHRYDIHPFKNQFNIVSSSAGSNWYSLADSKHGSVEFYRGGTYLTYYINCDDQNVGSISTTYTGETSVVMKKLTAAELSGQVKVSCYPGGSISHMLIRNVNTFDMHRNASNATITNSLNPNWGSTTVNWQITNTNITAATKKLFICALRGGSTIDIAGVPNISQNKETTSRLFQINKEQLTGSSIPIACGRTLQQTNAGVAYAAFMGMIIS